MENKIIAFGGKKIRRVWHTGEWLMCRDFLIRKTYKLSSINNYEMFPSDPPGSLDVFNLTNFLGGRFDER